MAASHDEFETYPLEVMSAQDTNLKAPVGPLSHHEEPSADVKSNGDSGTANAEVSADETPNIRSKVGLAAIIAAIYLSYFVSALNQTIIATSIPAISSEFKSASGYTWIGGAYFLSNAATGPIWAKISDIWGRKPIFLSAVAFFALSSIICALATNMAMLIAGRALQGVAGAGITQLGEITISDLFSMRRRVLYFGFTGIVWAIASGIGPVLGGVFTELTSWRWDFWISLPFAGIAFLLLLLFLDTHNPKVKMSDGLKAVDWFGSISILGLTVMLLLGLDFGGAIFPWNSPKVICLIVFGSLISILFIFSEKKLAQHPLMPLYLFSKPSAIASLVVNFAHCFVYIATEYYLPLYFQAAKSASPLRSGVLIIPSIVVTAISEIITGIVLNRIGRYKEIIWTGTAISTIGCGLFIHLGASSTIAEIIIVQTVVGIGSGMLFQPPLIALQALVPQDDVAITTSTYGFVGNLALAFSVVIGGTVFQNGMDQQTKALIKSGLPLSVAQNFTGHLAASNVMLIEAITDPGQEMAIKIAFAWSLRNIWIVCTCVSTTGIIASLFITNIFLSKEHTETVTGIKKKQLPLVVDMAPTALAS
ncbi:hypothetical protein MMC25_005145 [Agyrium rufum]|nr:hypothetical protein [Agyrium rufum]